MRKWGQEAGDTNTSSRRMENQTIGYTLGGKGGKKIKAKRGSVRFCS